MPNVPIPAAARYRSNGDPRPPEPMTRTREFKSVFWPLPPTSFNKMWRAYLCICSSVKSLIFFIPY